MGNLHSFLGSPVIGVVASYQPTGTTDVFIAGVTLYPDNTLEAYFPKGHNFHSQQLVYRQQQLSSEVALYRALGGGWAQPDSSSS